MNTAVDTASSETSKSFAAEAIVRLIEAASQVRRRYQFFVWTQSHLQNLMPHELVVCGAYQRAQHGVVFETFNSVPVPPRLLQTLNDGSSALMQQVVGAWIEQRGHALVVAIDHIAGEAASRDCARLSEAGIEDLLVHGVSRPNRPTELESFFMFSSIKHRWSEEQKTYLDLLLPQVHSAYLKAQAIEREMSGLTAAPPSQRNGHAHGVLITDRERQVLGWVREGMSNQQIGEQLDISPLTVKNHIQKILRKLSAANRAQAVAKAMTLSLLGGGSRPHDDDSIVLP